MKADRIPEVLDSTMLSASATCLHKFAQAYCRHLKPSVKSIHLHAGGAIARGLEVCRKAYWDDGLPAAECRELGGEALLKFYGDVEAPSGGTGANKSRERCLRGYHYYLDHHSLQQEEAPPLKLPDGKHAIEVTFCVPTQFTHPTTGLPIQVAGRFDVLADYLGMVWPMDEKTTSRLGKTWAQQWETRFQFMLYAWAMSQHGYQVPGVIIRGLAFYNDGYAVSTALTRFPPHMMQRFVTDMELRIERILLAWETHGDEWDKWPRTYGDGCNAYGGCEFRTACLSASPALWLKQEFVQREWSPLHQNPDDNPNVEDPSNPPTTTPKIKIA